MARRTERPNWPDMNSLEWVRMRWNSRRNAAWARIHRDCLLARMYRVVPAGALIARARLARPCRRCRDPRRGVVLPFVRPTANTKQASQESAR